MKAKLNLCVEDELWKQFKKLVPRDMKLNDAIVKLIEEALENEKNFEI